MKINKKIIATATVLSLVVGTFYTGGIQLFAAETTDITVSNVTYSFTNNNAGYADGVITVTSSADATFELYWGDSSGAKLMRDGVYYSELGTVTTANGIGSFDIISPYTAIPAGATKLLVYNGDEKEFDYSIPQNKQFNRGTKEYSFGLASDFHYNRYDASGADDALAAVNRALNFFEKTAKVSFVAGTGDLSDKAEENSFEKFAAEVSQHNLTVYTCMGNHDTYNHDNWKKHINKGITAKNASSKGILDVADNELDFVYKPVEASDDVFIFLSQTKWIYNVKTIEILDEEQLLWIEEMLAKYADKNVFLMFHTFISTNANDGKNCTGNLLNPGGYSYDLPYTVGTEDEAKMKQLLNKYPNVTMFSGHSHWAYSMQIFNPYLNIGQLGTGAKLVHVSSVTEPRIIGENDADRTGLNSKASEGMLADVYNNCAVYTGIDFFSNEYEAYATYISENGARGVAEVIKVPAKVKIKSAVKTAKKAKKAKITFKKLKGAQGYEIAYCRNKKFKAKNTTLVTTKKVKYTIKGLKPGKTYYVRVRGYIEKYGKLRYGNWSKTVKIKVKKK